MGSTEKAMQGLRRAVDKKDKYFRWRPVGEKGDLYAGRIGSLTCRKLRYDDGSAGSAYFRVSDGRAYPTEDDSVWFPLWSLDLESGERTKPAAARDLSPVTLKFSGQVVASDQGQPEVMYDEYNPRGPFLEIPQSAAEMLVAITRHVLAIR